MLVDVTDPPFHGIHSPLNATKVAHDGLMVPFACGFVHTLLHSMALAIIKKGETGYIG